MKNYLLTLFGEITSKKMCMEVAMTISPIVDSNNLKFQHKNGVLFMSFSSEIDKEEIYEYVKSALYGSLDTFVLTEINDKFSVSMSDESMEHLFDLDNVGDDVDMTLEMGKFSPYLINDEDEINDEYLPILLETLTKLYPKPTLDQLLDKINSQGYSSLTKFEKDMLEIYSEN